MDYSIIIPVYNHVEVVEACVDSILLQSLLIDSRESGNRETEIIVVNDGSTDDLASRISNIEYRISQANIRFQYIDQENRGAAAARNVGFDHSSGEYLFFCDADIILDPRCLERMAAALDQNPDAAFAYSQFYFGRKKFSSHAFDLETMRKFNYIHTSSLIRRSAFPRFDERLKKFQDWDLFLTIVEHGGRGVFIPEVLFKIKTGGTMSQWVPSFAYHAPFKYLPWWKEPVEKYEKARQIIQEKHNIQFPIPNSQ